MQSPLRASEPSIRGNLCCPKSLDLTVVMDFVYGVFMSSLCVFRVCFSDLLLFVIRKLIYVFGLRRWHTEENMLCPMTARPERY